MKKGLLLVIFVLAAMLAITACGKTNNQPENTETPSPTESTEGKMIIAGYDLTLNAESSFSKIKFKYPEKSQIGSLITSMVVDYKKEDSDESVVRVLMGEMYGTNIESSMEGFELIGTKTINGIEWSIYTDETGRNNYGFNIDYSNIVIAFMYDDPALAEFEDEFMNNVTLDETAN